MFKKKRKLSNPKNYLHKKLTTVLDCLFKKENYLKEKCETFKNKGKRFIGERDEKFNSKSARVTTVTASIINGVWTKGTAWTKIKTDEWNNYERHNDDTVHQFPLDSASCSSIILLSSSV